MIAYFFFSVMGPGFVSTEPDTTKRKPITISMKCEILINEIDVLCANAIEK